MQDKTQKHRRRRRIKQRVPRRDVLAKPLLIMAGGVLFLLLFMFGDDLTLSGPVDTGRVSTLNEQLLDLPPNKWVKLRVPFGGAWRRQAHAGMAFDTHRNKLFVFGSDTHGENWDNSVHEFDPLILQWSEHDRPARRASYRADAQGHPVSGGEQPRPWAMHTYDNVVYDPTLDAIFVMAGPEHNPAGKTVRGIKRNPTWIYELGPRQWRMLDDPTKPVPFGFAGASAYDSGRDVIVTYSKKGLWELGPDREHWYQATPESHHEMHHNMEYDSRHKKLAVFGDYRGSNAVWVYSPGETAGMKGEWEKKTPAGDACPKDDAFPVAFDSDNGVFVLLPDNPPSKGEKKSKSSSTFVYDLESNTYLKLPDADMPPLGMNYMMVYDSSNKVFLLVTGDWREPPKVWALHLELFPFEQRLKRAG